MHGRPHGGLSGESGKAARLQDSSRRRMLAVAKHKFARFGYAGVSLDDVAQGADLSLDQLQLHFFDKRALLMALLEESWESIDYRLEDIVLNALTSRDALFSLLALMMNVVQNDEDTARLLLSEGRHPDPESGEFGFSEGYRRFRHACMALVEHGQRQGRIRRDLHPQVITSMLIGAIEGLMRDRLAMGRESGVTPYNGACLMSSFDALIASLRPDDAGREGRI